MITLASGSEARARLLSAAGVRFRVEPASEGLEEPLKATLLKRGAGPAEVARELALAKARAVWERVGGVVIGADQTLEVDGALLSKAGSVEAGRERLSELRGREHSLHSAVAVAVVGEDDWSVVDTVRLAMRRFTDAFLDGYVARNAEAACYSLGGYHYEGEGVQLFERVQGDYFAVLGLPLLPLLARLREVGEIAA